MSVNGIETSLQVPVFFTNDFDVDENGVSYLVTLVYVSDEEEPTEIRLSLERRLRNGVFGASRFEQTCLLVKSKDYVPVN